MTDVATQDARQGGVALDPEDPYPSLEPYRTELTRYCHRTLGSASDAEDAAQETLLRAWRGIDHFEGRAKLRNWLYSIATNVCVDMLNARRRRTDLMALMAVERASSSTYPRTETSLSSHTEPPDPVEGDPAEETVGRDMVHLAFVALMRQLPSRQRAVLILREVLCWRADEVAELLDMTVAAVNSALQRARATLSAGSSAPVNPGKANDDRQRTLAGPYVEAFAGYDFGALVSLLREDSSGSA